MFTHHTRMVKTPQRSTLSCQFHVKCVFWKTVPNSVYSFNIFIILYVIPFIHYIHYSIVCIISFNFIHSFIQNNFLWTAANRNEDAHPCEAFWENTTFTVLRQKTKNLKNKPFLPFKFSQQRECYHGYRSIVMTAAWQLANDKLPQAAGGAVILFYTGLAK